MNKEIDETEYEHEAFDPLAGDDDVASDEGSTSTDSDVFLPYVGEPTEVEEKPADTRPAEERTAELFEQMKTRRRVLLGILDFCREEQPVEAVNAHVDELQEHDFSVFDAAALCTLLERAGAIMKRGGEEAEPVLVEEDGVQYMQAAEPNPVTWQTTEAGIGALDADKPMERLNDLFAADDVYLPIYLRILRACDADGGKTAKELGDIVDDDELVQKPRRYASYFFSKLADCDAVLWNETWGTTDVGRAGIDELEARGVTDAGPALKEAE